MSDLNKSTILDMRTYIELKQNSQSILFKHYDY